MARQWHDGQREQETRTGQVPETVSDLASCMRAGDGNRTRMTSLEGACRVAVNLVELGGLVLAGPVFAVVNGPLMARARSCFACVRAPRPDRASSHHRLSWVG
jgi:hypothetical protein